MIGLGRLIAGAALAVLGTSAHALPQAQYSVSVTGIGPAQVLTGPGTATSSGSNATGSTSAIATASGYQRVSAAGSSSGAANEAIAAASAVYYFGVSGPSAIDVPLILSGSAGLTATGCNGNSGCTSVQVYETFGRNGGAISNFGPVTCHQGSAQCGTFTYIQRMNLLASTGTSTGDVGFTTLSIYLLAYYGSASGFIDPVITIDPSFADASKYRIDFTAGTGNPGAVPEPAAWAMLLTGFAVAGGAMRRRRAKGVLRA